MAAKKKQSKAVTKAVKSLIKKEKALTKKGKKGAKKGGKKHIPLKLLIKWHSGMPRRMETLGRLISERKAKGEK